MIKKCFPIIIILLLTIISCTELEIITDPYWPDLVSDFQGNLLLLKTEFFIRGGRFNFSFPPFNNEIPDLALFADSDSDIYLLSPLLSKKVNTISTEGRKSVVYYFGSDSSDGTDNTDHLIKIKRNRNKAFFEAGQFLAGDLDVKYNLPIIYSNKSPVHDLETESLVDGLNSVNNNIKISYFQIGDDISEAEIENFFNSEAVINNQFIVILTNKWKNLCFELAEREDKFIVTSDSWFMTTYDSIIKLSIEDNIKGLLKKVIYNAKIGKLDDITLEGSIYK
jgi:hypothetical protein